MKNTQKHTRGPWKSYLYGKDSYGRIIATVGANDGNNRICELCAVDLPVDSIEANAQLIASAPDLLAVALALVEFADGNNRINLTGKLAEAVGLARAAIAKAEGGK
jgi:hypothetical protein